MVRLTALFAALAAALVGLVQLRHGIVPLLDTVTYWSGAEAVARGDGFATTLAPSFSNFSAIEFLDRGGSLPFVDFPVGYPTLAGLIGFVIGVRPAMQGLVIMSLAALAAGVVLGSGANRDDRTRLRTTPPANWWPAVFLGITGAMIVLTPTTRLVTQGALSEPLFCAAVLWLVIALTRYRHGGSWTPLPLLAVAASLLRFLGAPLAVLVGWERYRRTGRLGASLAWTAAMMVPAAANIMAAAAAGGGHSAGWRGVDRLDLETFVRSIGGWFDGRQGDIRRTYFTDDGPSWWSWPVAAIWVVLVVTCLVLTILRQDAPKERMRIPTESVLALAASGIMTVGLFAGIMGFDALVIADNRLMMPAGVLTVAAGAWWLVAATAHRIPASGAMPAMVGLALVLSIWTVAAVRPWLIGDLFSDGGGPTPLSRAVAESSDSNSPVRVVITNDADGVHWNTGIPAAYAPMPVRPLTGEPVDEVPLYLALPCALQRADGIVVVSDEATFSSVNRDLLDLAVDAGDLTATSTDGVTIYRPTPSACED